MRLLFFLAVFTVVFGCKTKQPTVHAGTCKTIGTVRDFDGLDGCGYLIELKGGKLLNPVVTPEGFRFKKDQTVRFDYQVLHDMASICMAESEMVEITCILDTKATNEPVECGKITNPFAVEWMNKAIDRHNPVRIIKYQVGGKWAFAFKAEPSSTYLYDCDGKLICESKGDQNDECHRQHLNFVNKGVTIWQGEGVWD
ncbi:MAG: hypothetical protein IPN76_15435 [Saprospiraceae bacterium]|nr:hypothetical protein [Saprospiraceae bacterium]